MKVTLKKWTVADKESLIRICNAVDRTYLSERMPFPYTKENADQWLAMINDHDEVDGIFRAVLVDDTIVGNISIELQKDVRHHDGEIGYFLLTSDWSKGIMSEAVKQICQLAFTKLGILRITGYVYQPNIASQRVLEKNGFKLEGILKKWCLKRGRPMIYLSMVN